MLKISHIFFKSIICIGAFLISINIFAGSYNGFSNSGSNGAQSSGNIQLGIIAPDFSAVDTNGYSQSLSKYRGKIVVLEWTNHKCPYVKKHYSNGNMQKLQQQVTSDSVVWLSIVSSAEGKQGYTTASEANQVIKDVGSKETARILDSSGDIGRLYGAKTTPHMFVIDAKGKLVYMGAIDSDSSANPKSVNSATNYVIEAVAAVKRGDNYSKSTVPYGCSVKY